VNFDRSQPLHILTFSSIQNSKSNSHAIACIYFRGRSPRGSSPRAAPRNSQRHRRRHPRQSPDMAGSARGRRLAAHHTAPGDASSVRRMGRQLRGWGCGRRPRPALTASHNHRDVVAALTTLKVKFVSCSGVFFYLSVSTSQRFILYMPPTYLK
jgi:hypothetical protein